MQRSRIGDADVTLRGRVEGIGEIKGFGIDNLLWEGE